MPFRLNPFTSNLDYYQAGSSGTGDVVGPASATDNAVARFDLTTGKLIQNSGVIIDDSNNMTGFTASTSVLTSGTLPIARGGTNSGTALNNNRVMISSGSAIVEASAITAARALISDANGIPTHSTVTSTELGYVSGVTSSIQTQLAAKISTTLGAIGSSPNANGATVTGTTLNLQPASASFGGVVTTSAQTMGAGVKTFADTTSATTRSTGAVVIGNGTAGGLGVGGRIHSGGLTSYATIAASSNQLIDIGASTTRFRTLNAAQFKVYNDQTTGGSTSVSSVVGVDFGNYAIFSQGDNGTRIADLANGANPSLTLASLYTDADPGAVATITNKDNGTIVIGGASVYQSGFSNTSTLDTSGGAGSTIIGYAFCNAAAGANSAQDTSYVTATGLGSIVIGAAGSNNFIAGTGGCDTSISAVGNGTLISGAAICTDAINSSATLSAQAAGSAVQGYIEVLAGKTGVIALISTAGSGGSLARGYVNAGTIEATNQGSLASGYCGSSTATNASVIRASGLASVALGRVINSGGIISSGNASLVSGNSNATGTITGSGGGSFTCFNTTSTASSTNSGAGSVMIASLASSGAITLSGAGSAVVARVNSTGTVTVSSAGSFFLGDVSSSGSVSITTGSGNFGIGFAGTVGISATGSQNCGQIFRGSNSTADSVNFGETIKILALQSATPSANGQIGMDSTGSISAYSTGARFLVGTPYVAKTGNYTLTFNDHTVDNTSGANTMTLPTAVGIAGTTFVIKNTSTSNVTVATTSSQTIDGQLTMLLLQYQCLTVRSTGANWIVVARY